MPYSGPSPPCSPSSAPWVEAEAGARGSVSFRVVTVHLLRHGHAGSRSAWEGEDSVRPLSAKGGEQAEAVADHLGDQKIDRILSSEAVRCVQTVTPLAIRRGLPVEVVPELVEGASTEVALALIRAIVAAGDSAALCSHGDVIPAVVVALAAEAIPVEGGRGLAKGTLVTLAVEDGRIIRATHADPRP